MVATGNAIQDFIQGREDVLLGALEVLTAERHLSDDSASMAALADAEGRMALAARRLAWAVDGLEPTRQPKGWVQ